MNGAKGAISKQINA